MTFQTLTSTDAFVVFDLDDAPATGVVRAAPKILPAGAADLARSLTYAFAIYGIQRGGASAGINASPDARDAAVTAFAAELVPLVSDGRLSLDAGRGIEPHSLATLEAVDSRNAVGRSPFGALTVVDHLVALGPIVATEHVLEGLDGRRIVIEGFGESGPQLARAATERGATVVAVSTGSGAMVDEGGLDAASLADLWARHGDAMVGDDAAPAWKVFATPADALLTGSKMGAINHETAERLKVRAVVPHAPIPYTARALAVMQRAGIVAVPDFIATGGPIFAWYPNGDATAEAVIDAATTGVKRALDDALGDAKGAFLGACLRAEAFLSGWHGSLPFGRPLAS